MVISEAVGYQQLGEIQHNHSVKKMKKNKEKKMETQIIRLVMEYAKSYADEPIMQSIKEDFSVSLRIGNARVLLKITEMSITPCSHEIDKLRIQSLKIEEIDRLEKLSNLKEWKEEDRSLFRKTIAKTCSKKCLLPFLYHQMNWICISILAAQYLNSVIIMRSSLEFLINVSTPTRSGGMRERISNLKYFSADEQDEIYELWKNLCSWSHPYENWIKKICPIFISYKPMYHSALFKECIELFEKILDVYCVIVIEHYHMDLKKFSKIKDGLPLQLEYYPMLLKRLSLE